MYFGVFCSAGEDGFIQQIMNNQKISAAWIGFSGNIIFSAFYESGNKLSEPSVLLFLSYYLPLLGLVWFYIAYSTYNTNLHFEVYLC